MNKIILSLNGLEIDEALKLAEEIYNERKAVEQELIWGFELSYLIYHDGIHIIKFLKDKGFKIMADLRMYDIPDIMTNNIRLLTRQGADIVTIHCNANYNPNTLGINNKKLAGTVAFYKNIHTEDQIKELTLSANKRNYGYILYSPDELLVENDNNMDSKKICLNVYPDWYNTEEKNKITLKNAIKNGVDLMIVNKPITKAINKMDSLLKINEDLKEN
jgi:orotidine-5'-phosphate decarboxylase